jgi:hypothetical protein
MTDHERPLREEVQRVRRLIVFLAFTVGLLLFIAAGLAYQVGRRNEHIDRIEKAVGRIEVTEARIDVTSKRAADASEKARDLVQGALEASSDAEERAATLQEAFRQIRAVYCVDYPSDPQCAGATP